MSVDLGAFNDDLLDLEAEASALGLPHAWRAVITDMRLKVLPNIVKKREQSK